MISHKAMNNEEKSNINLIKDFYETAKELDIRGKNSNEAIYSYAYFILDSIKLSKGRILDVGCGDGKIMAAISAINPSIEIDGIELSESLSKTARALNPYSQIHNTDALNAKLDHKYDRIFSFSFAQYLTLEQQLILNRKLYLCLSEHGDERICHLSIPDFGLKNAAFYVEYAKRRRLWRLPIRFFLNAIRRSKQYGVDGGMYHNPRDIVNSHKDEFQVTINRDSDSFYRFDYELRGRD